jgi:UDP-2,3-diacylglucosamine pyrophosphatase LpxH
MKQSNGQPNPSQPDPTLGGRPSPPVNGLPDVDQYLGGSVLRWDDEPEDESEEAEHHDGVAQGPRDSSDQARRDPGGKLRCRTVFISDVHLGTRGCQAKALSKLLKRLRCQKLYLVGDIIDMWRLRSRWYWPQPHNEVVRRVLKFAKRGTQVILIPGNHDEALRPYAGMEFGGVELRLQDVHETAQGRRLLITHGDQYDLVVRHARWLSIIGAKAYELLLGANTWLNSLRRTMGFRYWSLSQYVKLKVKSACTVISRFEQTLLEEAERRGLDGVVCGHIHKAHLDEPADGSVRYYNCGDWVESGTLLVEHEDGRMEILDGLEMVGERPARPLPPQAPTPSQPKAQLPATPAESPAASESPVASESPSLPEPASVSASSGG